MSEPQRRSHIIQSDEDNENDNTEQFAHLPEASDAVPAIEKDGNVVIMPPEIVGIACQRKSLWMKMTHCRRLLHLMLLSQLQFLFIKIQTMRVTVPHHGHHLAKIYIRGKFVAIGY